MVVDRGELRYRISVEDSFTKPIQAFRTELLKAKNTLEFAKESASGFKSVARDAAQATSSVRSYRQAATSGAAAERQANRETVEKLREIANEQRKRIQLEKLRANVLREQRKELEKINQAQRSADAAGSKASAESIRAAKRATAENKKLRDELLGTENNVNRVAFTFRRLFGILAAFTIARETVRAFGSLVSSAVQFNKTVEDSQVGLASLFVASGNVVGLQGEQLSLTQQFAVAQREAAIQSRKLRQDALKTTATYEELLTAFQAAVGPGLAANLNLDEVREVAVRISQAATAFQLEQNQLAEEVRALITGTGQLRTTRLAQLISNEDIRKARESGTLFKLLTDRLAAFGLAADVTQRNFSGLVSRLSDATQIAAGSSGLGFFVELKLLLADIGDLFVNIEKDAKGVIESVTPKPEAVQTLAILFDGLQRAVSTIRAGIGAVDLGRLQNAVSLISQGLQTAARVAIGFVIGLTNGLSDVASIAQGIGSVFSLPEIQQAAQLFTRIGVLLVAASLAAGTLGFAFRTLVGPVVTVVTFLGKLLPIAVKVGLAFAKIPLPFLVAAGAVTVLSIGLQQVASDFLGVSVSLTDLPEIANSVVEKLFINFFGFADEVVTFWRVRFQQAFSSLVVEAGIAVDKLTSLFDLEIGLSDQLKRTAAKERELKADKARAGVANLTVALENELTQARARRAQLDKDADANAAKRLNDIRERIQQATGDNNGLPIKIDTTLAEGKLTSLFSGLEGLLDGIFNGDVVDEKSIADKIAKLTAELEESFGKTTGKGQQVVLSEYERLLNDMRDTTRTFVDSLRTAITGFASFASSAIVDAFDPTQDVDLRERFARLLQDIAKQILQTIFTLLIATAIAKAFGVPLPSDNTAVPSLPSTFADGGEVEGPGVSFARPSYVPASDTVPAWLTPGEVVQSLDAVRTYGADFLLALNSGLLDPAALRDAAGLNGRKSLSASMRSSNGPMAFAAGGLVPSASAQSAASAAGAGVRAANDAPQQAVIVGNEKAMDRLLAGGKRAMLDFMRSEAGAINGILGTTRA